MDGDSGESIDRQYYDHRELRFYDSPWRTSYRLLLIESFMYTTSHRVLSPAVDDVVMAITRSRSSRYAESAHIL